MKDYNKLRKNIHEAFHCVDVENQIYKQAFNNIVGDMSLKELINLEDEADQFQSHLSMEIEKRTKEEEENKKTYGDKVDDAYDEKAQSIN